MRRFKFFFAWYDFWIGWYWDRSNRDLYICLLPCVVLMFIFSKSRKCQWCGRRPGLGEPEARWGNLNRCDLEFLKTNKTGRRETVGTFCRDCGRPNSEAGK